MGTSGHNFIHFLLFCLIFTAVTSTACQTSPPFLASIDPLPTLASTLTLPTPTFTATTKPPTATPTGTSTAVPPTAPPTATPIPTATPTASYQLALDTAQPQGYLSQFRLVAFYGSPTGPGLGILGELPREQMHQRLLDTIAEYEPFTDRPILPAYHLVTTVANPHPPL
ncbi:MAG: hypothetical protein KC445_20710, partial [Anaerolineales bacterium]|nr:hypothetical protein [Anaerolineales bacterium]